jgi:hypothetical protein
MHQGNGAGSTYAQAKCGGLSSYAVLLENHAPKPNSGKASSRSFSRISTLSRPQREDLTELYTHEMALRQRSYCFISTQFL